MKDRLFDPVEQREGKGELGETPFEFLQRGGRKEAIAIRRWMEEWFQTFPSNQKSHLKSRLKSKELQNFAGAYFELQVFAMLRRLNCRIEVEPRFPNTGGTVEFCATIGRERFYVEATVCSSGPSTMGSNVDEEDAIQKIRGGLDVPHSDLWLSATGELRRTLGKECVVRRFRELLRTYTADQVKRFYSKHGQAWAQINLSDSIKEGDWVLDGYLAPPIASDGRGQVRGPSRGGAVDGSKPLRVALKNKVDDWKKKELEGEVFLIALNACHPDFFWGDEIKAIFGCADPVAKQGVFSTSLSPINGIIAFDNMVLGAERGARGKMYRNDSRRIPECLRFLLQQRHSGELLGIGL